MGALSTPAAQELWMYTLKTVISWVGLALPGVGLVTWTYWLSSSRVLTAGFVTPGGCQGRYMDHTGCHKVVFLTAK
jgi:hypothetical protein